MKRMNKIGEFSFVWIFAILAGGAILFLAIWGAIQTGDTLRYGSDTAAARSISILTNPLEAGFAEGSYGRISFQQETRMNNICVDDGEFGKDDLTVSTRSGVGQDWNMAGGATSIHNKYIFSEEQIQGFDFHVFSKPFDFPYEINDLIFLSSGDYCFVNVPEEIVDEISGMGVENIYFENCSSDSEKVCFGTGNDCDVLVYGSCGGRSCETIYDYGTISKKDGDYKYVGNLMWAAIFSGKDNYDCNVERLLYRTGSIAQLFAKKTEVMDSRDCGSNLMGELLIWSGMVSNSTSEDLIGLLYTAEELGEKNERELCGVW